MPRSIPLSRRFFLAGAARLVLLSALLGVIALVNMRGDFNVESYTVKMGMWTLVAAFALSAVYAGFLKAGRFLEVLVTVQLVLDQVIWTVIVHLSGGISSGATSFYGVSVFFGAILAGYRGALVGAVSAVVCYGLLMVSLVNGWLLPPPDQPELAYAVSTKDVVYGSVINLLMLGMVTVLAGTLAERLRVTGGQLIQAEARANQAEREAALGRLAAGLAHEIRNPLSSISGSIRLLRDNPTLSEDERALCEIVEQEAARLNELVSDMLDLSRARNPERTAVDVANVTREVAHLASHSGRGAEDVAIVYEGDDGALVLADEAMLRQMLWNLVRNAVQASHADSIVRTRVEQNDDQIVVSVIDHGEGLDHDAKLKIFDAFFTTRSRGTGIGLAVVKRIVDQHQWQIEVEDTPGGGASFRVIMAPWTERDSQPAGPSSRRRWTLSPESDSEA